MKRRDVGSLFAGARVAESVPLAPLTTLRVGPVARTLVTCDTTDQVVGVLRELDDRARNGDCGPVLVFAGGSNVVIGDALADLTVVRVANDRVTVDGNLVRAEAGTVWDEVVVATIERGLGGLECLSGIPGSAGATPVQNVGAYGVEVSDVITRVRLLDRSTGDVSWVPAADLSFGYRTSVLKQAEGLALPAVVLEVEFALDASGRSAPLRYGELTAALGMNSGERGERGRSAMRCWRCGRERAWCLTPRTMTPGAWGRFSPIPWSRPRSTNGWRPRPGSRCRTTRHRTASSWLPAGCWSGPGSARVIPATRTPDADCPASTHWL